MNPENSSLNELTLDEAKALLKARRKHKGPKEPQSLAYFIPVNVIEKIVGVPGVKGVNIYLGMDKDTEFLVLVPTTFTEDGTEDIIRYRFQINDLAAKTITAPMYKAAGPHPPPSTFNSQNELNYGE